ncbi:MAG: metallophosphoesterase [Oscillospiraceae bacterium]|nr:metallophosphoesterase [Oscillospiraceae bacterium]
MNSTVSILHLSDLHIVADENNNYSNDLALLINDIVEQINSRHIGKIIVVVTGDIIDKGEYKYIEASISFFTNLHDKIKKECPNTKIIDIQIVPGNHDRSRDRSRVILSTAHRTIEVTDARDWKPFLKFSSKFLGMVNNIYRIFNKTIQIANTFGVELCNVDSKNFCFIRFDSSWCACTNNDERNIRIGEYQLQKLKREYDRIKEKEKIDITIAISHHPTSWLNPNDELLLKNYMMIEKYLNVDIFLCGHTHNLSVENLYNHEHSLLSLVTGIGWGEKRPGEINEHRYSIYSLNILRNCCEIYVRKTKRNSEFEYDFSIYSKEDVKNNKLMYPIKMYESFPFIHTNSSNMSNSTGIYIDMSLMSKMPEIVKSNTYFNELVSDLLNSCQVEFLMSWEVSNNDNPDKEIHKEYITDHFSKTRGRRQKYKRLKEIERIMEMEDSGERFASFLNELLAKIIEAYKSCFSNDVVIRAHFRRYNKNVYSWLCSISSDDDLHASSRDVSWDSLIEVAYNSKKSIVFSTNEWHNPIKTQWNDFLTLVPVFKNYEILEHEGINEKKYPALSFGLSLGDNYKKDDSIMLYLLSFLKIEEQISKAIDRYVKMFCVDINSFIDYENDTNIESR